MSLAAVVGLLEVIDAGQDQDQRGLAASFVGACVTPRRMPATVPVRFRHDFAVRGDRQGALRVLHTTDVCAASAGTHPWRRHRTRMDTARLVSLVTDVLDDAGVPHGVLRVLDGPSNQNVHVTDDEFVFCKVATKPGSGVVNEPRWTRWAYTRLLTSSRPLVARALTTADGHAVGVYSYEKYSSARTKKLHASGTLGLLETLHTEIDPPRQAPVFDPHGFVDLIEERHTSFGELVPNEVRAAAREAADTLAGFDYESVPIHGDPNMGNVVLNTRGQWGLVDFESFAIGPREWDYGQLLRGFIADEDTTVEDRRWLLSNVVRTPGLDMDVMDANLRLRGCESVSFRFMNGAKTTGHSFDVAIATALGGLEALERAIA